MENRSEKRLDLIGRTGQVFNRLSGYNNPCCYFVLQEHCHLVIERLLASCDTNMDYLYQRLTDSYLGLVHAFQLALSDIFSQAVNNRPQLHREQRQELLATYRNKFDQLPLAEEAFRHFGLELLGELSEAEQDGLRLAFAKRHALKGRPELIEKKYLKRIRPWPRRFRRVTLSPEELEQSQRLVDRVFTRARTAIIGTRD